jgi:hypothetical protein
VASLYDLPAATSVELPDKKAWRYNNNSVRQSDDEQRLSSLEYDTDDLMFQKLLYAARQKQLKRRQQAVRRAAPTAAADEEVQETLDSWADQLVADFRDVAQEMHSQFSKHASV